MQSIPIGLILGAKTRIWWACVEDLRTVLNEKKKKGFRDKCGHLLIYVNQSGCLLFQRHMVHKLRWVCDENDHSIKKKTWLTHSTCAILHIKYLYLMCLCVQPVYHRSIVVRGRYRAGWLWDKTLVCILVQPSHFIANAQPVSETTIYWFCYYRYSRVMLRTQHCDLNLHSRIHTPPGALCMQSYGMQCSAVTGFVFIITQLIMRYKIRNA